MYRKWPATPININHTCEMMNGLEAKSKPTNFQQLFLLLALVQLANVLPVYFTEDAVVPGKKGWALKGSERWLPQSTRVARVLA